jgi:hypothetical protein
MKRNDLQETLVSLYLRLNGYFLSSFIVHAPGRERKGNRTQVDALGVRFPYNSEPEREIRPSDYLQIPVGVTDILLCEVKGGQAPLQFNNGFRNPEAIRSVLRWIGAFEDREMENLVQRVGEILTPRDPDTPWAFRAVPSSDGRYQLRAILFAPDRKEPRKNQTTYVHGQELLGFIGRCLREEVPREHCTTHYDFGLWGGLYEPIVRLIKCADHDLSLADIYDAFLDTNGPAAEQSSPSS